MATYHNKCLLNKCQSSGPGNTLRGKLDSNPKKLMEGKMPTGNSQAYTRVLRLLNKFSVLIVLF
jgi:hypothetical protein